MNVQHLWTALFSFSLHLSPSIPKADARLGFLVSSASRAEPWPKLMIRCTTGTKPGLRRKSMEKEALSAVCLLVSVVSAADGQVHGGLGHSWALLIGRGITPLCIPGLYFTNLFPFLKMLLWACFYGFSGNSTNYLILFSSSASNSQNIFTLIS